MAEGEIDVSEGVFQVEVPKNLVEKHMAEAEFTSVDRILREQGEKVVGNSDFDTDAPANFPRGSKKPGDLLRKALSTKSTWEEIEGTLLQGDFWVRDGDPREKRATFDAHDGSLNMLRLQNFWRSRRDIIDKQRDDSTRFAPKAQEWLRGLLNEYPGIGEYLELDMGIVWSSISNLSGGAGVVSGQEWGRYGSAGNRSENLVDIRILCLPSIERPSVKIFRLRLSSFAQVARRLILRSYIKVAMETSRLIPREEYGEAICEALHSLDVTGVWKIRVEGNAEIVKIRYTPTSEWELARHSCHSCRNLESASTTFDLGGPGKHHRGSSRSLLSGPQIASDERFPASHKARKLMISRLAAKAFHSTGGSDHTPLSLAVVQEVPDGRYAQGLFNELTETLRGGPQDLLICLTQAVFVEPHPSAKESTGRFTVFGDVLSEKAWPFRIVTNELNFGSMRDHLVSLEQRLKDPEVAITPENPFLITTEIRTQEIPILDVAVAAFGDSLDADFIVYHRFRLVAMVNFFEGDKRKSTRDPYLEAAWERRPFRLRGKLRELLEST